MSKRTGWNGNEASRDERRTLTDFAHVRGGGLIFCMNCGHIPSAELHHDDCPTRQGKVWKDGKWRGGSNSTGPNNDR
jgi:hypothetical protein